MVHFCAPPCGAGGSEMASWGGKRDPITKEGLVEEHHIAPRGLYGSPTWEPARGCGSGFRALARKSGAHAKEMALVRAHLGHSLIPNRGHRVGVIPSVTFCSVACRMAIRSQSGFTWHPLLTPKNEGKDRRDRDS